MCYKVKYVIGWYWFEHLWLIYHKSFGLRITLICKITSVNGIWENITIIKLVLKLCRKGFDKVHDFSLWCCCCHGFGEKYEHPMYRLGD